MQRPARLTVALILVSIVVGCTQKAASTADTGAAAASTAAPMDTNAESKVIVEADSAWMRHLYAKDLDSLMMLYTDDAVSYGPDQKPAHGTSEIRSLYTEMIKTPMSNPKVLSNEVKFSDDGTMAYDHGTYQMTVTMAGKPAQTVTGAYLNTWKKVDGKWKLAAEMSTPVPAPKS